MMRVRIPLLVIALFPALAGAQPTESTDDSRGPEVKQDTAREETTSTADVGSEDESARKPSYPIWIPPKRGAPVDRLIGGATREGSPAELPEIRALVPMQAALTLRAQPTLYWYLAESVQTPVTLTVVLEGSSDPLVDTKIAGPLTAGIQPVRLTDFGVRLESGPLYKWFIVIREPYGGEPGRITGGTIERIEPTNELSASLAAASSDQEAFILAENGIWYDAVAVLSEQVDASPTEEAPKLRRAAFLESAGLEGFGDWERSTATRP